MSMSSDGGSVVCLGGVFVVGSVGLQAAVEDADEAVGELAKGGLMADVSSAELLVVGVGPGEPRRAQKAHRWSASPRRRSRA